MRHSLFEQILREGDSSWPAAKTAADSIVKECAESLVGLGVRSSEARSEVLKVVPQIQKFEGRFLNYVDNAASNPSNLLSGNGVRPDMRCSVNSVRATEECIVSHELGLKGNIDATVDATTSEAAQIKQSFGLSVPQLQSLVPVELKTGQSQKPQNAHMAQLALYVLMLGTRHGANTNSQQTTTPNGENLAAGRTGMLLYLNHEGFNAIRVSPMMNELKSLIGQRNLVASELYRVSKPRGIEKRNDSTESNDATTET